jgi:hypothetical protein
LLKNTLLLKQLSRESSVLFFPFRSLSIAAHKHHHEIEKSVFIAARRSGNFSLQSCVIGMPYNKIFLYQFLLTIKLKI